ncbi:MAG: class I SAM-dependent methyltransferase [Verrucomicrobiota bacterium]
MLSPTQRFSNRVDNYIRYRPSYPHKLIELLQVECGLTSSAVIADIGSGTGKLTEHLLPHAKQVFAIEPNQEMRAAGERLLKAHHNFTSINGTAEATTLPDCSVDLIVAGQAFHWFDRERAKTEFQRILKPGGYVALIWNDRQLDSTPFLVAYESLLRSLGTDCEQVNHRNIDAEKLRQFFGRAPQQKSFPYVQPFGFAGLKGRLLSSSYAPAEGEPGCDTMLAKLREIFAAHQQDGQVAFCYDTVVYFDRLM